MRESLIEKLGEIRTKKTTKSERKLAEFFLENERRDVLYMSITELADETQISPATILRFCRFLGFKGFQEFKLNLAQHLMSLDEQEKTDDPVLTRIAGEYTTAITNCMEAFSLDALQKIADWILSSSAIVCCGVGHSRLAAHELHNRLLKLGILSHCEHDTHIQNILLSSCTEKDLLVVFSISGGTKDVIEATEIAKRNGMKIAVITCHEKSPLAKLAGLLFCAPLKESPANPGTMSSQIMQLYTVDAICRTLYERDPKRFQLAAQRSNEATADKLI